MGRPRKNVVKATTTLEVDLVNKIKRELGDVGWKELIIRGYEYMKDEKEGRETLTTIAKRLDTITSKQLEIIENYRKISSKLESIHNDIEKLIDRTTDLIIHEKSAMEEVTEKLNQAVDSLTTAVQLLTQVVSDFKKEMDELKFHYEERVKVLSKCLNKAIQKINELLPENKAKEVINEIIKDKDE